MGFFKKLFGGDEEVSDEIKAARRRHGIEVGPAETMSSTPVYESRRRRWEKQEEEIEEEKPKEVYDPWEDIKAMRYQFFVGGLYRSKARLSTNHDAIRKDLEEATRKREEKYQQKQQEKRLKKEEKARKKEST